MVTLILSVGVELVGLPSFSPPFRTKRYRTLAETFSFAASLLPFSARRPCVLLPATLHRPPRKEPVSKIKTGSLERGDARNLSFPLPRPADVY